jgi:hypothetical protein
MKRNIPSAIAMLAFGSYATTSQAGVTYFNCSNPATTDATVNSSNGDTTARGTIVCSKDESQNIGAKLLQKSPSTILPILSNGQTNIVCSGSLQTWEVKGRSLLGKIEPRNATLQCWAGFNEFDPRAVRDEGTITVREAESVK